jgi:hypothetical protein
MKFLYRAKENEPESGRHMTRARQANKKMATFFTLAAGRFSSRRNFDRQFQFCSTPNL